MNADERPAFPSRRWVWLLAFGITCLASPGELWAADSVERSAARQLAQQGVEAYQAQDYATALDRLERAYQTLPTPALALWTARSLEKLGRWVEASELYLQATRIPIDRQGDTAVQEEARKEAASAREQLSKRIPTLVVELEDAPAGVEVHVGERTIGAALLGADLPMDPGLIQVSARTAERTVKTEVRLAEGERKTVRLSFSADGTEAPEDGTKPAPLAATTPTDQPSHGGGWHKPVGWTAIGLGAAGIAIGAAFGLDAMGKKDASASECNDQNLCSDTGTNLRAAGMTSAAISTVAFAAGAAVGVGGVVLLLTAPRSSHGETALAVVPTFGGAGLVWRGSF